MLLFLGLPQFTQLVFDASLSSLHDIPLINLFISQL